MSLSAAGGRQQCEQGGHWPGEQGWGQHVVWALSWTPVLILPAPVQLCLTLQVTQSSFHWPCVWVPPCTTRQIPKLFKLPHKYFPIACIPCGNSLWSSWIYHNLGHTVNLMVKTPMTLPFKNKQVLGVSSYVRPYISCFRPSVQLHGKPTSAFLFLKTNSNSSLKKKLEVWAKNHLASLLI